jgi:ribosomal protein S18 acetylase RimI-like enzyme
MNPTPSQPAEDRRFTLLDHHCTDVAESIRVLLIAAYTVEAQRIGASNFPPLRRTAEHIARCGSRFFGRFAGNALVAVAEVEPASGTPSNIAGFAVHPSAFRRGHGAALLRHVLESLDPGPVTVSTASANEPAIRLYEAHGFRIVRRWSAPDGFDLVTLARIPL